MLMGGELGVGKKEVGMMWDSPLYAMNMFSCHWLIKKLLLANDLTE